MGSAHDPGDLVQAFEFQIPYNFNSRNPAVEFAAEDYHSVDCKPFVCEFPSLDVYLRSKTCPMSTNGFLVPNTPMVHIHIAVFDKLTVIGVTSSQVMFDVVGTQTLLCAWTRLLAGENVDAIRGMDWDVALFESFRGLLVPLVQSWMRGPEVRKLIRVPKAFLEELKREIMLDLKLKGLSERVDIYNVLLAWWLKISYSVCKCGDKTPIHVHRPVNLRPMCIFPGDSTLTHPYINNASSTIPLPPLAISAFQTEPLGKLALRIWHAITLYHTDLRTIQAELCWLN
ncbi:hypothetical protein B0H17DRAFT_1216358 [Mycena rosella]|uniref:Uncharacterized protein n=1 Tax=Mycena rosella TaxID=1033263 RepID=A0AAD7C9K6_MYCRO|nr:hypothetical protein B0H17DRAFT_1216358 [Mycena rosella]